MVDFKAILEKKRRQKEENTRILETLNALCVPGDFSELTWDRICLFAQDYDFYMKNGVTVPIVSEDTVSSVVLSEDQEKAWNKLKTWVSNDEPYFVLQGFAGTGKSFLMKKLLELNITIFFSAPTNKATKVLGRFVETEARTTFSTLGLRMNQDDDELVMEYGANSPYFPKNSIFVVDEASMIGKKLFEFIEETRKRTGFKVLYVGDPAQLPPVGEKRTKAWTCTDNKENLAVLRKVMRYDNQLLKLATNIRKLMKNKEYGSYPIVDDNDGNEGVFLLRSKNTFAKEILKYKRPEDFTDCKIIAWRNKTVNNYNNIVRKNFGFEDPFNINDIILLAEPIEKDGVIIAHIDDEFTVLEVETAEVKTSCKNNIPVHRLWVENEEGSLTLNIPIERSDLEGLLEVKAMIARRATGSDRRDAWRDFWETKQLFASTRYAYAMTAHRSQGSSYKSTYIDQHDILTNSNKREAFKCLYVAATRATTSVYTY